MITNYCCCTWDRPPFHTQYNQIDLLCNSSELTTNQKIDFQRYGVVFDDTEDNISRLNYTFAELTGHYWVWKNSKEKVVSITHYRRFWFDKKNEIADPDEQTIIVTDRYKLPNNETIYSQFSKVHGDYLLNVLDNILSDNEIKYKKEHFEQMKTTNYIHPCNMFIATKSNFDKICEILFEVLFEVYSRSFKYICTLNNYQIRAIGFLSERILTTIFMNIDYYIPNGKLKLVSFEMYK